MTTINLPLDFSAKEVILVVALVLTAVVYIVAPGAMAAWGAVVSPVMIYLLDHLNDKAAANALPPPPVVQNASDTQPEPPLTWQDKVVYGLLVVAAFLAIVGITWIAMNLHYWLHF